MTRVAPPARPRRAGLSRALRAAPLTAGLTGLVLLLRLWIAHQMTYCGTPDSCAYLSLGESLSRHRGFVENFLYQYQMIDVRLPQHGVEYWRPGTSFFLLLAQPFGGVTLHSSLVVTILAGVLLAGAAWRIASRMTEDRSIVWLSFALCLVLPPLWANSMTPDSALFYGAFVAWFLALFRVRFESYAEDALAWVCLVIVTLIRNDAILLLPSVLVVLWLRRRRGIQRGASTPYCGLVLLGFFAAMVPMRLISHAVLGTWKTANGLEPLYLLSLSDLLYYHQSITLHTALAAGLKHLVRMRVNATATIVYRVLFLMLGFGVILLPGASRRESRARIPVPEWQSGAAFAVVTILVYGLVLPAIGTFSALRTWNALLPLAAVLMVSGTLGYTANARAAKVLGGSVVAFYVVLGFMDANRSIQEKNQDGIQTRKVARYLAAHGALPVSGTLVMTANAAQFSETTSYAAVPLPANGIEHLVEAVRDLHPRYVLLNTDANHPDNYEPPIIAALQPVSAVRVPDTEIMVLTLRTPQ